MDKILDLLIFDLSDRLRIALILLLISVNYLAEFLVKRSVEKVYRRTASAEEAINKLRIYNQYCLVILQIITIVPMQFMVVKFFIGLRKLLLISFLFLASFALLMIVNVGQLLIINKTYQRIRGTTESLFGQIRDVAITLLLTFVPVGLLSILTSIAAGKIKSQVLEGIAVAALPLTLMFLFNLTLPFLYPLLLKAVPLGDEGLKERLDQLFDQAGIKRAQLYQWPTKAKKVANALVVGLVKPKVFISDYYLENAEPGEIEAVVAHEVGHLKHNHLLKRLLYIAAGLCELFLVGYLMEWYENHTGKEINFLIGLAILLVPFFLYISLGLLQYYRKQEKQADEFALKIGVQPEVMITALLKLTKLNHMVPKLRKLDGRFQTHPSLARRIRQIEKISGYRYDLQL